MSGAARKEIRALAVAALAAAPALNGLTEVSAWSDTIDAESLPAYAVAIIAEANDTVDLGGTENSIATLLVVLKAQQGDGDLDDGIDDLADAAEAAVVAAVTSPTRFCSLGQTTLKSDYQGARRVATATLQFAVTYWG